MKKFTALLLALIMLVVSLPVNTRASEIDTTAHDQLVALACEVFPEYADTILNKNISSNSRSSQQRELIFKETRNISDSQYLTYSEYSDNLSLVTYYNVESNNFDADITEEGYQTGAGGTVLTVDIVAGCLESGYWGTFTLNNVQFTLLSSAYDRIDYAGSPSYESGCSLRKNIGSNPVIKYAENASSNAYITYHLNFWIGAENSGTLNSVLTFDVGDNDFKVEHIDYNDWV